MCPKNRLRLVVEVEPDDVRVLRFENRNELRQHPIHAGNTVTFVD